MSTLQPVRRPKGCNEPCLLQLSVFSFQLSVVYGQAANVFLLIHIIRRSPFLPVLRAVLELRAPFEAGATGRHVSWTRFEDEPPSAIARDSLLNPNGGKSFDQLHQLFALEGLGEVVVETGFQETLFITGHGISGERHGRHFCIAELFP